MNNFVKDNIIKMFLDCSNLEQLKKVYIHLLKENHPDKGGDLETCQFINEKFSFFENKLKGAKRTEKPETEATTEEAPQNEELTDKLKDVIFSLSAFPLNLEICGSWLWVSGCTWLYSKQLKELGCIFASKKKMWCFHESEWKKRKHKLTMDEIRNLHGSAKISTHKVNQISRG